MQYIPKYLAAIEVTFHIYCNPRTDGGCFIALFQSLVPVVIMRCSSLVATVSRNGTCGTLSSQHLGLEDNFIFLHHSRGNRLTVKSPTNDGYRDFSSLLVSIAVKS